MDDRDLDWCKHCGARIRWVSTVRGSPMPIDPEPHPRGNLRVTGAIARIVHTDEALYITHFATCGEKSMAEQVPSIGRVVHVKYIDGTLFPNNAAVAKADITAHFGGDMVNLRVTVDGPPEKDMWATSIHQDGKQPSGHTGLVWFWPPRV